MDILFEAHSSTGVVTAVPLAATIIGVIVFLYLRFFYVDYANIQGIPEIPGGRVLAGHLYELGKDHATTAETWASQYGWSVFQIRMGQRRAIFINSFEAAREWMVKNQAATLDRPWFYTFHGVVSATSGKLNNLYRTHRNILTVTSAATIGTSPWDERTKKQRRVVGSFTTGPSIQKLKPMLDMEISDMIAALYSDSCNGTMEIMPHIYQKRLALNIMTMFCYGTRFSSVTDPLLHQILEDASTIAR